LLLQLHDADDLLPASFIRLISGMDPTKSLYPGLWMPWALNHLVVA
jgi:hypothetical protein